MPKCARRICQSITIVNDVTVEDTESFFIDLNRTASLDSRISLVRVTSRITITDDDSKSLSVGLSPTASATITTVSIYLLPSLL